SSFIWREASLKSVPSSSTKNFSNPALVPALLTSTDTFSCSVSMYSSAILDISGYTVPEPSMTILPSSAPLFSFSSEDPPFCDSFQLHRLIPPQFFHDLFALHITL